MFDVVRVVFVMRMIARVAVRMRAAWQNAKHIVAIMLYDKRQHGTQFTAIRNSLISISFLMQFVVESPANDPIVATTWRQTVAAFRLRQSRVRDTRVAARARERRAVVRHAAARRRRLANARSA